MEGDSENRHLPHPQIVEIEVWGENDLNFSKGGLTAWVGPDWNVRYAALRELAMLSEQEVMP